MMIQGFALENEEKIQRVIEGQMSRGGLLVGGIGDFQFVEPNPEKPLSGKELEKAEAEQRAAWEVKLLVQYDRLGGYITKNGLKVKSGAFWDGLRKTPKAKPEIVFISELDGEIVEVDEEEAQALSIAKKKVDELKKKKLKKAKKQNGE